MGVWVSARQMGAIVRRRSKEPMHSATCSSVSLMPNAAASLVSS